MGVCLDCLGVGLVLLEPVAAWVEDDWLDGDGYCFLGCLAVVGDLKLGGALFVGSLSLSARRAAALWPLLAHLWRRRVARAAGLVHALQRGQALLNYIPDVIPAGARRPVLGLHRALPWLLLQDDAVAFGVVYFVEVERFVRRGGLAEEALVRCCLLAFLHLLRYLRDLLLSPKLCAVGLDFLAVAEQFFNCSLRLFVSLFTIFGSIDDELADFVIVRSLLPQARFRDALGVVAGRLGAADRAFVREMEDGISFDWVEARLIFGQLFHFLLSLRTRRKPAGALAGLIELDQHINARLLLVFLRLLLRSPACIVVSSRGLLDRRWSMVPYAGRFAAWLGGLGRLELRPSVLEFFFLFFLWSILVFYRLSKWDVVLGRRSLNLCCALLRTCLLSTAADCCLRLRRLWRPTPRQVLHRSCGCLRPVTSQATLTETIQERGGLALSPPLGDRIVRPEVLVQ